MQHPVQSASFSLLWSSILSYSSTISASTQRTKLIQTNSSRGKNHEQVSQDDAEFRTVCCLYELLSQCRYRIQDGTESIAEMIRTHLQQIRRLQGPALVWGEHWVAVTGVGLGRYLLDHVVFPNHSAGGDGVGQQSRVLTVQIMRASAQVLQQTLRSSPILFASTSTTSLLTLIWKEAGGMPRVTEAAHGSCSCVSCRASVSRMVQRLPASMRSAATISEANIRRLHCCASLEGFLCRFLLQCFGESDVVSPATQPASQWMGLPGNDVVLAAKLTACIVAHAFTQWANLSEDLAASASLMHALAVLFSGSSSCIVFERLLHPQGLHVIPRVGLSSYHSFVTVGHCIPIEDVSHRAWWVCRRPSPRCTASEAKGPHEWGQGGLHRDGWQLHQAAVHFVALYCSLEMDDQAIEGEGSVTTGEVDPVVRWFDMLAADAFTDVSGPQSSTADRTLLFLLVVRDVVPYNTVVALRADAEQFQKQMVVAEQVQIELLIVSGIGQTAMHRLALDIGQLPHASLSESLKQRPSVPRCDDENSRLWSSCPAGSTVSLFEWGFDSITFYGPRTTSKQEALLQLQFAGGQDHPQEECPPQATNRAEPIVVVLCGRVLSLVAPLKAMVFTQLSFLRSVFCNRPTTTVEAGLSSSLVVAGHGSLELALCTVLSSTSFAKDVRRVWRLEHEEKVDSSNSSPTNKEFRSSISVDELEWEATLDHVTRGLREALFTWLIVTLQQHLGLTYDNSQSRVEVALLESSAALARSLSSSPSSATTTTLAQLYSDTVVAPTLRVADDLEAAAGGAPPFVLLADVREWIPVSQLSCLIHEAIALSADILSIGRITVRAPDLAGDTFALS